MAMGLIVTPLVSPVLSNAPVNRPSAQPADQGVLEPVRQGNASEHLAPTGQTSDLSAQAPKVKMTFGKYSGEGLTEAEALRPIQQASYADIMAHEMAHYSQAGSLAASGPVVETNGKGIAIAGHVNIRLGGLDLANPEASYANAHQAMCAACAPSDMSAQDQSVAASASRLMCEAQALIQQKQGWTNLMANAAQSTGGGPGVPSLSGNRFNLQG